MKAFNIVLSKISHLKIKNKHIQGSVYLLVYNPKLPNFNIKKANLKMYFNGKFITPITSVKTSVDGEIHLKINADLSKLLTLENVIYGIQGKNKAVINGFIEIQKEFVKTKVPISETFIL